MKTTTTTAESRWAKRSLPQQLLYKFLNEYGYERGPVIAKAIISDMLSLIDQLYSDHLPPRFVNWPVVSVANGTTGKSPDVRELVTVRLQLVTDDEVALLNDEKLCGQRLARRTFNQTRFVRLCHEAFAQGGVMTLLDLSLLSGIAEPTIGVLLRDYEADQQTTVPIRGTVHDTGPSVSHKAEVIRRYLRGQSPALIARELTHSQQAVDTYIKDYEVTRQLVQHFEISAIPALCRRSKSLVNEHIKLIRQFEPTLPFFQPPISDLAPA
ncbi:MAG: DUF1670 domain-containing protein [Caldilineaceae bacterium]|nr:DUF1670 domain-containing protein [Caldilineaceae bacterium]